MICIYVTCIYICRNQNIQQQQQKIIINNNNKKNNNNK